VGFLPGSHAVLLSIASLCLRSELAYATTRQGVQNGLPLCGCGILPEEGLYPAQEAVVKEGFGIGVKVGPTGGTLGEEVGYLSYKVASAVVLSSR
jgi:hypothetical protein